MKKIFVTLFVGIFFLCVTIPSYARTTYYYSWITTCGFVIDREFSYELTDAQCLFYSEMYEELYCSEESEIPEEVIPDIDGSVVMP